jgi:predicted RNA-binding protein with PIN domain
MTRTVVDGMNVIGSRPDGWWRDRDGAARRLLLRLQHAATRSDDALTLVLDGRPPPDLVEGEHGGVDVRYARRRGRDAADDRIVELVAADAEPATLCVVTSDRALADRVTALGATTEGAGAFLRRLERLGA